MSLSARHPRLGAIDLHRRSRWVLHAAPGDEPSTSGSAPSSTQPPTPQPESARIQRTMADLDALLGIQEEPSKASPSKATGTAVNGASPPSPSADAIPQPESESQRLTTLTNDPKKADLESQFGRIIERARKLADQENKEGGSTESEQAALRKEFESLLQNISTQTTMDKEDIKKLKEAAFGPQTYFVTETVPLTQPNRTGLLVRGNLRDERTKVFELVKAKVRSHTACLMHTERAWCARRARLDTSSRAQHSRCRVRTPQPVHQRCTPLLSDPALST